MKHNPSTAFTSDKRWQRIKKRIHKRDNKTCRICSRTYKEVGRLNVAHILPRRRYPERKFDMNNLVLLCAYCSWNYGEKLMRFKQFREQVYGKQHLGSIPNTPNKRG